ncbi:MAG: hypothetical protein OZSIB_2294 [Candidatus Ozemobacter sibiricus]|jgi:hypothetical protein|uniref:Menorin-like domain-containing protein n=1 Tax=Candidatus Ozemobacter sibiricus TaxID=2268124 RepID=A0A367ZTF0_9BACT|nr:MAG: hypothetical protein OZSIB_2294 [Candidatus Ozemobacter sibiricus]
MRQRTPFGLRSALSFALVVAWFGAACLGASAQAATPFQDAIVQPPHAGETTAPEAAGPPPAAAPFDEPARAGSRSWLDKAKGLWDKATGQVQQWTATARHWFGEARRFLAEIFHLPGWISQARLSERRRAELLALARARPDLAWPPGRDIARARNAHRTNTYGELKAALSGPYDWLECDVRLEGPLRDHLPIPGERRPITAHDPYQTNGLLFEDWVKIANASGRGLKLDFKANAAIAPCIALLQKEGVDPRRLIMNIGIPDPGPGQAGDRPGALRTQPVSDDRLTAIRRAFPQCLINLSPGVQTTTPDGHYTARQVDQMIRYARAAGPPVMFPLRAEMVTREIVQALKPYGKIAIWNSPSTYHPADVEAEIRKFREWGVDGMIDIMTGH